MSNSDIDSAFQKVISDAASGQPAALRGRFQQGLAEFVASASQGQKTQAYQARKVVIRQHLGPGQLGTGWSRTYEWGYGSDGAMTISVIAVE